MPRGEYVIYTLVNPLLTEWSHDDVNNSDGQGTLENRITVAYEAVFYESGRVSAGANGAPRIWTRSLRYNTKSHIACWRRCNRTWSLIEGAFSLYDFIASGEAYENPY